MSDTVKQMIIDFPNVEDWELPKEHTKRFMYHAKGAAHGALLIESLSDNDLYTTFTEIKNVVVNDKSFGPNLKVIYKALCP